MACVFLMSRNDHVAVIDIYLYLLVMVLWLTNVICNRVVTTLKFDSKQSFVKRNFLFPLAVENSVW